MTRAALALLSCDELAFAADERRDMRRQGLS